MSKSTSGAISALRGRGCITIIVLFAFVRSYEREQVSIYAKCRLRAIGTHSVVYNVCILDGLVFRLAAEALLLDASDVQHISLANDAVQVCRLGEVGAGASELALDAVWHAQRGWRNKVDGDRVEGQKPNKGVNGPAVLQISNHGDGQAVHSTQFYETRAVS